MTPTLLQELIEKAKKEKKVMLSLKAVAVKAQLFELAASVRELEKEYFPESEEEKKAKEEARKLNLLFRMVDLTVSEDICWLVAQVLKAHNKKKGKFTIDDAADLLTKKSMLFLKES